MTSLKIEDSGGHRRIFAHRPIERGTSGPSIRGTRDGHEVRLEPDLPHRVPVSGAAAVDPHTGLRAIRQVHDPPVPGVDQQSRRVDPEPVLVGSDRGHCRPRVDRVDQHDGSAGSDRRGDHAMEHRGVQEPVDLLRAEHLDLSRFDRGVPVRVDDHQCLTRQRRRVLRTEHHPTGEGRRRDLVRDESEHVRAIRRRRAVATRFGAYPRSRAMRSTRSRVSRLTLPRPLNACDTVVTETPASRATSRIPTRPVMVTPQRRHRSALGDQAGVRP